MSQKKDGIIAAYPDLTDLFSKTKISVITLGTVIFQGTLGGLTVYYLLPIWISASHGTIAQTTLCLTVLLTVSTSKKWIKQSKENMIFLF